MKEQKKNKGAITENTVNITYALRCQQARYKPSAGHKICIKLKMAESRYIIMLRGSRSGPVEIVFFFSRVSYQEEYWIGSAWMATDFLLGKTAPNKVHCGFCVAILMNENPPREKRKFFCRAAQ